LTLFNSHNYRTFSGPPGRMIKNYVHGFYVNLDT